MPAAADCRMELRDDRLLPVWEKVRAKEVRPEPPSVTVWTSSVDEANGTSLFATSATGRPDLKYPSG